LVADTEAPCDIILGHSGLRDLKAIQHYNTKQILLQRSCLPVQILNPKTLAHNQSHTLYAKVNVSKFYDQYTPNSHTNQANIAKLLNGQCILWAPQAQNPNFPLRPLPVYVQDNSFHFKIKNKQEKDIDLAFFSFFLDIRGSQLFQCALNPRPSSPLLTHEMQEHDIPEPILAGQCIDNSNPPELVETDIFIEPIVSEDPYPWLPQDDPRRKFTDRDILREKVSLKHTTLTGIQKEELFDSLIQYKDAFSLREEIGTCHKFEVHLQLKKSNPFFIRPYDVREEQKELIDIEMKRLERLGIIQKGHTGYSSPIMLIKRKQQNLFRVVTDFRVLNDRLVRINHAFPLLRDCLQAIGSMKADVFSVIDLRDAFHTLRLSQSSQQYCGIVPYYGSQSYHYVRMGMGLTTSPAVWQQFIDKLMLDIPNKQRYRVIMDDILVFSPANEHLQDLIVLFQRLIDYGLKISPHKCQLFSTQLVYMGLVFMIKNGIPCYTPIKDKCDAIRNLQPPRSVRECRRFCGILLIPIYNLIRKKKNKTFEWTPFCQKNFDKIKDLLIKPPVLAMPKPDGMFRLESDTSVEACGGALYQEQDGQWKLLGYHSKRLPEEVRRYGITELELTGLVVNINGFKQLLKNRHFEIIIDHKAIEFLTRAKTEPTTARITKLLRLMNPKTR